LIIITLSAKIFEPVLHVETFYSHVEVSRSGSSLNAVSFHWFIVPGGRFLDRFVKWVGTVARDAFVSESSEARVYL
jgi:hypothetical protein